MLPASRVYSRAGIRAIGLWLADVGSVISKTLLKPYFCKVWCATSAARWLACCPQNAVAAYQLAPEVLQDVLKDFPADKELLNPSLVSSPWDAIQ